MLTRCVSAKYVFCANQTGLLNMQINYLPAGGAVGAAEIESVHKAELRSQTLLYQTLQARLNKYKKYSEDNRFSSDIVI